MKNLLLIINLLPALLFAQDLYKTSGGQVKFRSDAPLELIQAETKTMNGALKISDRSFAFSIPMKTFEGFNSSLQRTHFNENYLQSDKFPNATFEGKIIEEIDFSKNGTYNVRGKGKFKVHGVEQERIIRCKITISQGKIVVESNFTVMLADHDIKIPTVVAQKLAEEVEVQMSATLTPR
jgi:polyisoprenoid-binding protein YceI